MAAEEQAAADAAEHGIRLEVVKLPTAKRGFVLLPHRWVVERSFGWLSRFRRLARDYERLSETLADLRFVAFAMLMAHRDVALMADSSQQALAPHLAPPPGCRFTAYRNRRATSSATVL